MFIPEGKIKRNKELKMTSSRTSDRSGMMSLFFTIVLRSLTAAVVLILLSTMTSSTTTTISAMTVTSSTTSSSLSGKGRIAVVTGASRGIGRGIALELGSAGYTVYCLGRSTSSTTSTTEDETIKFQRPVGENLDLTVESAAEEITNRGGIGIPVPCDLSQDGVIEDILSNKIIEKRLDILVCSAYTTPPTGIRGEFWKQDLDMWDYVNGVGLRQVYAACRSAVPIMIETAKNSQSNDQQSPPLICLVSSFGGKSYTFNVAYGVGKAAIDRLSTDMSYQLSKHGVATTTLYPGLVQTEANLQMDIDGIWDEQSGGLDLSVGETPSFSGKAVVQLASLSKDIMMKRSGQIEVVAELATEFNFYDNDNHRPSSIRSLKYLLPNFVFPTIEKENGGKPIPNWIKNNVPDLLVPWSTFSSGPPPDMDAR
jgi:dehydrogenase/reductase SDR family protein 1